jgi:protein MpaA
MAAAALALGAGDAHAESIGKSVQGRPIKVRVTGARDAALRIMVVGSIHGNETAGHAVIRRLRALEPPDGMRIWTVRTVNPDGVAAGTRENAHAEST